MKKGNINHKKILRVFPNRTSYTPNDDMVWIGAPGLIVPEHDKIHISCTFTWDKEYCTFLKYQWEARTQKEVVLGGPAFSSPTENFIQGMYVKPNIIFTTRGCNNRCPWCCVHDIEGSLKELPICEGNIIQDNNFLQASRRHKDKVFNMLKSQKGICFRGGLEPDLIDDHFINNITSLRIKELWLACDLDSRISQFATGCEKLVKAGYNREKIHCYVLSYGKDREADEERAKTVYKIGAMPFVQLYRDFSEKKTQYSTDWNAWARMWQRPASIKAHVEKGTDYKEYYT